MSVAQRPGLRLLINWLVAGGAVAVRKPLVVVGVLVAILAANRAYADMNDPLETRVTEEIVKLLFPEAEGIRLYSEDPPFYEAYQGETILGYLFSTYETVRPGGYAGDPFDIIVGMGTNARITGAVLLEHTEPIIGPGRVPEPLLIKYFDRLLGIDITRPIKRGNRGVDGVTGATITATLMHSAILQSGRRVARQTGLLGDAGDQALSLDITVHEERPWQALIDRGEISTVHVTEGDVATALGGQAEEPEKTFAKMHVALATPGGIGRNIFGDKWYNHHLSMVGFGEQLLTIINEGPYSYKTKHREDAYRTTGPFSRVRIVQNDHTIELRGRHTLRHTAIRAEGSPSAQEIGLFRLFADDKFDPLEPWSLEVIVATEDATDLAGANDQSATFKADYLVPTDYVVGSDFDLEEAGFKDPQYVMFGFWRESTMTQWQAVWVDNLPTLIGVVILLSIVTLVFVFQDLLARYRRLHFWVRTAVLAGTLFWLGWTAGAQLTIINLIAYARAAVGAIDPTALLMEPAIVLISGYTVLSLILLGRGVFCGWLCPFGALQELANKIARFAKIPQFTMPYSINERLWAVKYVVLVVVAAAAFHSMETANAVAEVEPFKTAISLKFDRSWPYVAYALILVLLGLFTERFFCRFLCPLGAALVLLGRGRVFQWLKRRSACGTSCHICERSCPVQAIPATGAINMNECFQCLDCQVDQFDDTVCPPLVKRRKQKNRLAASLEIT